MGNSITSGIENYKMPMGTETPHYKEILKKKEDMTPWERVKFIFHTDEFNDQTPEYVRCKETTLLAFIGAGIFGGVGRSRIAYVEFFKSNAHTVFTSPFEARRQLQDKILLGFGAGCWKVGWRAAAFTAMFTLGSTCLTAYRGKTSVLDYMGGGATAGFLYKLREGPKSMVVGVIVGSVLGGMTGTLSMGLMGLTGLSQDEFIKLEYESRQEKRLKEMEKNRLKVFKAGTKGAEKLAIDELQSRLMDDDVPVVNANPSQNQSNDSSIPIASAAIVNSASTEANSNSTSKLVL